LTLSPFVGNVPRFMPLASMNIWKSLRGLPRDVWILAIASLINRAGTMVLPFLVLYLTRELGLSIPRAGLALAVYGAGAIVAGPISGRLTDNIGPVPIMRASLILSGVLLLAYPFVTAFPGILAMTLVWAIVNEMFRPANMAMIAEIVPAEKLKPAYALLRLAINVGMSVGPAVAGFLATRSFFSIFIVDAATTIAAGLVLVATPLAYSHLKPEQRGEGKRASAFRPIIFDDMRMLLFLSAIFLTGAVFFQHEGALPLFLVNDLKLSPAFYGMLFTVNTVLIVFTEVPLNAATASWPHSRGLAIGAGLFAIGSGGFAIATGPVFVVVSIIIWTFGEMMLFPQAAAYVAEIAPAGRRGEYMGAYSVAFSLAFAISPWAGTAGLALLGARWLWIIVFVVGAIGAVIMSQVTTEERAIIRA
jgi:MFS family permease